MRIVEANTSAGKRAIDSLVNRGEANLARVEPLVRRVLSDVRRNGDVALRKYAMRLDDVKNNQSLSLSRNEMQAALRSLKVAEPDYVRALELAANNIRRFARWQKPHSWIRTLSPGIRVGQIIRPLDSVGCYVPGGRYPLPSTLLMTVLPAQVAGVKRIVVVSPRPSTHTLAAAALLGITEFYRIGGAQAVAALAYGTRSLAQVDKIVGPGNSYVTAAKRLCGTPIDMLAGPTEALVASHNGNPRFIAADLVAQAEHDPEAVVTFITSSKKLANAVAFYVAEQSGKNAVAKKAIARNGCIIVTRDRKQALSIANAIAGEHLTVDAEDATFVRNAGSLFIGDYSTQPAGDYATGPNHVLPTGGLARARGGLSVNDFVKTITVQRLSRAGLRKIGPGVVRLAQSEGLTAHAGAVLARTGARHA